MSDRYASFAASGPGRALAKRLGLPQPVPLRRWRPGDPLVPGPVLVGGDGRLGGAIGKVLDAVGAEVRDPAATNADGSPPANAALVFDATGIADSAGLRALYDFFHPRIRSVYPSGRVVVLGTPPEACDGPAGAVAQRALEGFVRSVGKEAGRGVTANLVYATAEADLESTLRFLLSARSAYVCGQVIRVARTAPPAAVPERGSAATESEGRLQGGSEPPEPRERSERQGLDWDRPLAGKVALVTGAARGIGAAIARVLARDGAHVVCLDVPAAGQALSTVANELAGSALQLDLTAPDAPQRLAGHLKARHGGVDVVVHNAGILRDRTVARMEPAQWDAVLDVNLSAQERVNAALLDQDLLPPGARVVSVSSIAGIAGNRGQTNYATSKAGVIGMVEALAPTLAGRGVTVNAVAPGVIETAMIAKMPLMLREAGRRMNSMSQAGLPVDVAEAVAYLAGPGSAGVTGQVLRVCGQSLIGA
jgi:3-oxoacyl-[acyl-carrier protein] reductase